MKHSDLKVGMKVKRVDNFNTDFYTSTKDNISTVSIIYDDIFNTEEDGLLVWDAQFFEPVQETKEEVQMKEDNKISLDKKYRTRCGYPVRVLCVDRKNPSYPVLALINEDTIGSYTATGFQLSDGPSTIYDLIEVSPWEDFKKDDKVMVRDNESYSWSPRYFAGVFNGKPYVYYDGGNSWTKADDEAFPVIYCRKPTQEELES